MNLTRTVIFGVVGGALAAWLAAAATSGPREVVLPPAPRTSVVDASAAELAAEIARLHDRLHPTVAPQQPARNLFEFTLNSARIPTAPGIAGVPGSADVAPAGELPASPDPAFALIGVAEDGGVRTAIISAAGQLFLVKDGDLVGARYHVAHVGADAVDLEPALHLTLK